MCKNCGRTFNDKTGTISKVPLNFWFYSMWGFFVESKEGRSIRQQALNLNCSYAAAYRMLHNIVEILHDLQMNICLSGNCETDKFYVHSGLKGDNKKVNEAKRCPQTRGVKPQRGRGLFED